MRFVQRVDFIIIGQYNEAITVSLGGFHMTDTKQNPRDYLYETESVPALTRPVVTLLNPCPGERILDLGCGNNALTKELADMGCEMVGIDTSAKMVAAAKAVGIDARLIDGRKLDIEGTFDAVFSHAALRSIGWRTSMP